MAHYGVQYPLPFINQIPPKYSAPDQPNKQPIMAMFQCFADMCLYIMFSFTLDGLQLEGTRIIRPPPGVSLQTASSCTCTATRNFAPALSNLFTLFTFSTFSPLQNLQPKARSHASHRAHSQLHSVSSRSSTRGCRNTWATSTS